MTALHQGYELFIHPFIAYGFLLRAFVACFILSLGAAPVGVLLILRRMSLIGDAMSHAIMPGAAIGFLIAGSLSLIAMGIGGLVAGLIVVVLSSLVSQHTLLKEDATFASFYLFSLATGVLIISLRGSNVDLMHVLFGTILAIDANALYLVASITTFTLLMFAVIYRALITESFDPVFLRSVGGKGNVYHIIFMMVVVINLVSGFEALGTLMAVGMIILPAVTALLWATTLPVIIVLAMADAIVASYFGLIISFYYGFASGPTIILVLCLTYFMSLMVIFGFKGLKKTTRLKHQPTT